MGLFDLFSSGNEEEAARQANQGLQKGYGVASDLYGQGRSALGSNYAAGLAPFQSLFDQSQKGAQAYADASGANGPEGMARARTAFTQTPGYSEGLNSGLDSLDRRAASRGMLASGNNNQDTLKFASDYANNKFGSYLSGLQPYLGQGTASAAGIGGLYGGLGNQLNSSFMGQGNLGYNTEAGIGKNNAAAELSKDQTGMNILNGIMGIGKLGTNLLGMF